MKKILILLLLCFLTSCQTYNKAQSDLEKEFLSKYRGKEVLNIIQMKDCLVILFTDGTELVIND